MHNSTRPRNISTAYSYTPTPAQPDKKKSENTRHTQREPQNPNNANYFHPFLDYMTGVTKVPKHVDDRLAQEPCDSVLKSPHGLEFLFKNKKH